MTTPDQARDAGIAERENAADPRWVAIVDTIVERWAKSGRPFSANDIRDEVPAVAQRLVAGRLRSAWMRKPRLIEPVGEIKSDLTSTHAKKICIWIGADFAEAYRAEHGVAA